MINRFSSRLQKLDKSFLNVKLDGAYSYDRIAGYFCSSILEVAGESIENVAGNVRIICNSSLQECDVYVAKIAEQKMQQEWCSYEPEEKFIDESSSLRLKKLYNLLITKKLEIRVIPDEKFGLIHGKAGVITYNDGTKTSFLGSINETKSAFKLNYELIWEDDSPESVKWVQDEFDFFWNCEFAVPLCDFIIKDIKRISQRVPISIDDWKKLENNEVAPVAVEDPVCRKEFGLWEHQKYFVELAFREHKTEHGARYLLADQVGLGKTLELAMSIKLMALYGSKPILIIVPKTLTEQWQDEIWSLLELPSAYWNGRGWIDEKKYFYPSESSRSVLKCPRRVGIISQGLVARKSEISEILLEQKYECVVLDEAHRARRRNPTKNPDSCRADLNFLLQFLNKITFQTHSLLLATATPVQVNVIEAFDLVNALSLPVKNVMGDSYSWWHSRPQKMLNMICGNEILPTAEVEMWSIMRNPFPNKNCGNNKIGVIRDQLNLGENDYIITQNRYEEFRLSIKDKLKDLYFSDDFVRRYNPYISYIIRRTRSHLENTIDPNTGETYLKKIGVILCGENDEDAIPLHGYLKEAYACAEDFCHLLAKRVKAGGFMSTLMLKRIGSTICAGENTAKKMLSWSQEGRDVLKEDFDILFSEDDEAEMNEDESEIKKLTYEEIEKLTDLVKVLSNNRDEDPKYNEIIQILNNGVGYADTPWKELGCIVFSQYYDSANYVAEKLSNDINGSIIGLYAGGDKSGIFIDGCFTKKLKEDIKTMVKMHQVKILVGTDAASEGLNLQTLSTLINVDLPWNPTRLEQRKGRIQRIGQNADFIKIYNMRYKDSVEDKVHKVLSSRLQDIYSLFGQIPDTLEDVWIQIANDNLDKANELIRDLPSKNPFEIKYEEQIGCTKDWQSCSRVLEKNDKLQILLKCW